MTEPDQPSINAESLLKGDKITHEGHEHIVAWTEINSNGKIRVVTEGDENPNPLIVRGTPVPRVIG